MSNTYDDVNARLADGTVSYVGGYERGLAGIIDQLLVITKQKKADSNSKYGAAFGKSGKAWVMGHLDGLADGGHEDLLSHDQMRRAHEWLDSEPD